MDVYCAKCGEPWDNDYLRHEAIGELDVPGATAVENIVYTKWKENWDGKLTPIVREAFAQDGWKFGASVYNVKQCPACKDAPDTKDLQARSAVADALEDVMAGDDDGLVSELNALGETFGVE